MASATVPAAPCIPHATCETHQCEQTRFLGTRLPFQERPKAHDNKKTTWSRVACRAELAKEAQLATTEPRAGRDKGWFYNSFVAEQTMDARLKKMREESAATKGRVNTLFDDSFQYTAWIEVHRVLTERKLPSVEPQEALRMATATFNRATLLDVREAADYQTVHAEGAFNAPLFRLIEGNDLKANLRRLGYALLTDFAGTERNPDFVRQAEAAVKGNKGRPVIVMCSRGGTLDTIVERKGPKAKKYADPWRTFGISSRSLKACYELQEAGFKKVIHLKGGLNQWNHEDFPIAEGP